jgi:hypothetical protein
MRGKPFLNWLGPVFLIVAVGVGLTLLILTLLGHDSLLARLWVGLAFGIAAVTLAALQDRRRR